MDFYEELEKLGVQDILNHTDYEDPQYENWDPVNRYLLDIVNASEAGRPVRVLVYGDYDVDGLMCAKVVEGCLTNLGVQCVDVYHYTQRTHNLDTLAVQQAILGKYDYFIVCDTGSSNMELLKRVIDKGIRVLVLDHHVTAYSYEDFSDIGAAIINTTIENRFLGEKVFELSAGALCFTVMHKFCFENGLPFDESLAAYGTVSLYSDCMNMTNALNRAIYYVARKLLPEQLPHLIRLFMNQYTVFGARYIGFWFSPRINALFRSENFELLNRLVFDNPSYNDEVELCELVESVYSSVRDVVNEIVDIIEVTEYDHFVVGALQSVDEHYDIVKYKLYNYTGLVANKLSEEYGKACVVYCPTEGTEIKGSLRDFFSRDYLSLFVHFCNAGGHASAFGFHIGAFDLDNFLNNLQYISDYFPMDCIKEPMVFTMTDLYPDDLLIEDIAKYNEFSGQGLPIAYVKKQIVGMKEVKTKYNYKYIWGDYSIQSSHPINFGTYALLKPIRSVHTKLLVQ